MGKCIRLDYIHNLELLRSQVKEDATLKKVYSDLDIDTIISYNRYMLIKDEEALSYVEDRQFSDDFTKIDFNPFL